MNYKSRDLKKMARIVLNKNWGYPIFLTLTYMLLIMMISIVSSFFGLGTTTYSAILAWVATVILSLITGLFAAGLSYAYLNLSRGIPSTTKDLFAAFRMSPDRFLIVGLIMSIPNYLMTLPTFFMPDMITAAPLLYLGLSAGSYVLTIAFSCFFCLSNYLLLDHPDMGALEALRTSIRLMRGYKGKYLYLTFSFVGWVLLSIFTLCISLLWIEPYMHMTLAFFYISIIKNSQGDHMHSVDEQRTDVPFVDGQETDTAPVENQEAVDKMSDSSISEE